MKPDLITQIPNEWFIFCYDKVKIGEVTKELVQFFALRAGLKLEQIDHTKCLEEFSLLLSRGIQGSQKHAHFALQKQLGLHVRRRQDAQDDKRGPARLYYISDEVIEYQYDTKEWKYIKGNEAKYPTSMFGSSIPFIGDALLDNIILSNRIPQEEGSLI